MNYKRCPSCGILISVKVDGLLRAHRIAGLGSRLCTGSGRIPDPDPIPVTSKKDDCPVIGRMPLPGNNRTFSYQATGPLSYDDVERIKLALLSHVDEVQ